MIGLQIRSWIRDFFLKKEGEGLEFSIHSDRNIRTLIENSNILDLCY